MLTMKSQDERFLTSNAKMLTRLMEQFPQAFFRIENGEIYVFCSSDEYQEIWRWFWNNS